MATADQVCETRGGAWRGASPTTTVPSVFMPRIAPPYTPKSITWRASSVAPRAITCAASCTPWPPNPVMRSSRSTQAPQYELLEMRDVALRRAAAGDKGLVHAPDHQVIDHVGVALRVAAGVGHRFAERRYEKLLGARHLVGEAIGEARVVDREGPGVGGGGRVARLLHHAADPRLYARRARLGAGHAVLEIGQQLTPAVVEDRDEQLVLAPAVPVEGLVRGAPLAHDVGDAGVERAGTAHHCVAGVDEAADLVGVGLCAAGQGPGRHPLGHRRVGGHPGGAWNGVLHLQNHIPAPSTGKVPAGRGRRIRYGRRA